MMSAPSPILPAATIEFRRGVTEALAAIQAAAFALYERSPSRAASVLAALSAVAEGIDRDG